MEFLTVNQAALRRGVSPQTIRDWITRGLLPVDRRWGVILLLPADVDAVTPKRAGRPAKAEASTR